MKIKLFHRHYGKHSFIKECEIEGTFEEYGEKFKCERYGHDYSINEERLLKALPKNFLPANPKQILVTVEENRYGQGITNLKLFHNWAKYFDAYSISLVKSENK